MKREYRDTSVKSIQILAEKTLPKYDGVAIACTSTSGGGSGIILDVKDARAFALELLELCDLKDDEIGRERGGQHIHLFAFVPESRYGNMPAILVCPCGSWRGT